ncbi:hypothetical protein [Microbulbifer taiwanensis]|uniref:CR-type domain-containing protein n=1 Tax=Microbulbifer taiwanensis TaxID=986746 RepID=A0ABW1YW65_9GAMM
MKADIKAPAQVLDESLQLHFQLIEERAIKVVDAIERKQALHGSRLRKRFPCIACEGDGLLSTLTFYGPLGGRPGDLKRGNGQEVGAFGAVRCFVCDGSGVDHQAAGLAHLERAKVLQLVRGGAR